PPTHGGPSLSLHDALPISRGDAVRRHRGVMAEGAARSKPALFVEANRRRLKRAGFETQYRPVGGARLLLDTGEQRLPDTALAGADRKSTRLNSRHLGIAYA